MRRIYWGDRRIDYRDQDQEQEQESAGFCRLPFGFISKHFEIETAKHGTLASGSSEPLNPALDPTLDPKMPYLDEVWDQVRDEVSVPISSGLI